VKSFIGSVSNGQVPQSIAAKIRSESRRVAHRTVR